MPPDRPGRTASDDPSSAARPAARSAAPPRPDADSAATGTARHRATPPDEGPRRRRTDPGSDRPDRLDRPDPTDRSARRRQASERPVVRARRVHRIVRRVDPWSVLKISLLFYLAVFLIVVVAGFVLWNGARSAGTIDDVEDFVSSLGFGNCELVDDAAPATTTTVAPGGQVPPPTSTPTTVAEAVSAGVPQPDTDAPPGEECGTDGRYRYTGEFRLEDGRVLSATLLGGLVLVVAGAAFNVVLVVLFNLISDLLGGIRVTVLEEEPPAPTGSPRPPGRG